MYSSQNDPSVGILEFIACWTLYFVGSVIHMVFNWTIVTQILQATSFTVAILVGVVNLLRALGFDVNLKRALKRKK